VAAFDRFRRQTSRGMGGRLHRYTQVIMKKHIAIILLAFSGAVFSWPSLVDKTAETAVKDCKLFETSEIALFLSIFAIGFTIFSFWWLNVRRGKLVATDPQHVFGRFESPTLEIKLPFALENTGPRAIVVSVFRLRILDPADRAVHFSSEM